MKKEVNKIKVGLFVLIGLGLFTIAVYMLGRQKNLFGSTFHLNCVFHNVGGLQVGNNVRFTGINVGTVEDIIIIRDTAVLVKMVIQGSVKKFIKADSKAIIGSEGLMGDKIINISAGSNNSPEVKDEATIKAIKPVEFDQILANLKETTENAAVITGDLADIMENIHEGRGTVGALLMDSSFAINMKETLRNVKKGTSGFSDNMEAAKHSFLFRGYFKRKQKEKEEKEKAENQKPANPDNKDRSREKEKK